jgi:hypothetical protein
MFGRRKTKRTADDLPGRNVSKPEKATKPKELSPAEKIKAHSNSAQERRKSAPAV